MSKVEELRQELTHLRELIGSGKDNLQVQLQLCQTKAMIEIMEILNLIVEKRASEKGSEIVELTATRDFILELPNTNPTELKAGMTMKFTAEFFDLVKDRANFYIKQGLLVRK